MGDNSALLKRDLEATKNEIGWRVITPALLYLAQLEYIGCVVSGYLYRTSFAPTVSMGEFFAYLQGEGLNPKTPEGELVVSLLGKTFVIPIEITEEGALDVASLIDGLAWLGEVNSIESQYRAYEIMYKGTDYLNPRFRQAWQNRKPFEVMGTVYRADNLVGFLEDLHNEAQFRQRMLRQTGKLHS